MEKDLVRKGGKGGHSGIAGAEGEAPPRRGRGGRAQAEGRVPLLGASHSKHTGPDDRRASCPPPQPHRLSAGSEVQGPCWGSAQGACGLAVSGLASRVSGSSYHANVLLVYCISPGFLLLTEFGVLITGQH